MYPLMPLRDIHLHSDKGYEQEPTGEITYVYWKKIGIVNKCWFTVK